MTTTSLSTPRLALKPRAADDETVVLVTDVRQPAPGAPLERKVTVYTLGELHRAVAAGSRPAIDAAAVENARHHALAPAVRGEGSTSSGSPDESRLARVSHQLMADVSTAVRRIEQRLEFLASEANVLASRATDPSHFTIAEVATLKMVTTKTIRNWVRKGVYTVEVIPGTRKRGIPVRQLSSGWMPEAQAETLGRGRR